MLPTLKHLYIKYAAFLSIILLYYKCTTPSNGGTIYHFFGKPAMWTHWMTSAAWLQTTQPTSGGAVTAVTNCCANCAEPCREPDLPFFGQAGHVLLLTKAGNAKTNPGPTTLNRRVWICDICYKQIHVTVRKQISIRCNRIEHCVHPKMCRYPPNTIHTYLDLLST